ncbi:Metallo-dependent phosphatase-like protein [Fomes fomentarius]|nr:Metallo-dependent phosphatase-like protein [Fomes fomentarius]
MKEVLGPGGETAESREEQTTRSFTYAALLFSATGPLVRAEDVLYSRRALQKRQSDAGNYNISFYHVNDVHSHLDEFASSGTDCTRPERGCFGGYARIKHVVNETRPGRKNSLFFSAGDEFQGTLFFTYYGGEKIAETMNQMGFDGMTLGNHEFDRGDDTLGAFLQNLTFPIISANIVSDHAVLNKTITPYHIYEEHQLAVIGVMTETTNTIDLIRSTTNITRIATLTHIGYEEDQKLAEQTTGLYLIMGGHSHTPLGDFEGAEGPYPTIKKNKDGEEVFIVTAYRWGEYLGYIDVSSSTTALLSILTNQTKQDDKLRAQIKEWRGPFEAFAAEVLGKTAVELDQTTCQKKECLLGDFITDVMLTYRLNSTDNVDLALVNAGGIRATIDEGEITRGERCRTGSFWEPKKDIVVLDTLDEVLTRYIASFEDKEIDIGWEGRIVETDATAATGETAAGLLKASSTVAVVAAVVGWLMI